MDVLGEVVLQVVAFGTGLLVLATVGMGIYMRVSARDLYTGRATVQPRSWLQWWYQLFYSLMLLTSFAIQLVPTQQVIVRAALLALGVVCLVLGTAFFVRFLQAYRGEQRASHS